MYVRTVPKLEQSTIKSKAIKPKIASFDQPEDLSTRRGVVAVVAPRNTSVSTSIPLRSYTTDVPFTHILRR